MGVRIDRFLDDWRRRLAYARRRSNLFDHIWRAVARYDEVRAGRLAAAATYYSFFAVFGLILIGFAVLGLVFADNATVVQAIEDYLRANLPQTGIKEVIDSSRKVGVVAIVALVVTGVAWVESLRESQRAIWGFDQQPGNPINRWLIDLGVLLGLGLLLLISVAVYSGVQDLLLRLAGEAEQSPIRVALRTTNVVVGGLVDLMLGAALLAGVPRLRVPRWRLLPSALLFAVGMLGIKTAGKWYITRTEHNPAYQVAAGTVGLLLFMYLLHQVLLMAAALAATSQRGRPVDLANRHPSSGSADASAVPAVPSGSAGAVVRNGSPGSLPDGGGPPDGAAPDGAAPDRVLPDGGAGSVGTPRAVSGIDINKPV